MNESRKKRRNRVRDPEKLNPRVRPVVLAADALKILSEYEPGANASQTVDELSACMDKLLMLQERLPSRGQCLFVGLNASVTDLQSRLAEDVRALDSVHTELTREVVRLGDVLMRDLMPPLGAKTHGMDHADDE